MTPKQLDRTIGALNRHVDLLIEHANNNPDDERAHAALLRLAHHTTMMASRFARFHKERDGKQMRPVMGKTNG